MTLPLNGLAVSHVPKRFVPPRAVGLKCIGLFISIPINNSLFCEPFQKNLWESVNCTCSIMVLVESLNVILLRNVDGQSVCQ
jgi:hypothetical protein